MALFPVRPFAAGFACVLLLSGCGSSPAPKPAGPREVGTVTLEAGRITLSTELPGRVTATETSEIRPQVSGIIERRLFREGALVRKGELLYQIQDAPYRAALDMARGNLATAQAAIRATGLQADRYHRLIAIKGVSQQDSDNADAASQQARAAVQTRQAEVEAARVSLGFTQIRAPISGRIGRSLVTVGALAQAGQAAPLATIQNMGEVYVDLTQPAAALLDLREAIRQGGVARADADGPSVELTLPNGAVYPIRGRLAFSEVTVDASSGSVTLRATFPNPDGVLLPGLYVRARIVEGTRTDALLVPQQGISRDERGQSVALVVGAGNKVERRVVQTDRAIGDKWVVTGGLKAGDRLIVEGLVDLKPGTVVAPKAPEQVTANRARDAGAGRN